MPSRRGITCSVKTDSGVLKEWGVKTLRGGIAHQCFIQAETGARFRIHLTPDLPFEYEHWRSFDAPSDVEASSSRARSGSVASSNHNGSDSMTDVERRAELDTSPPFHLLATVYLDGRSKPERRSIVYLDPSHDQSDGRMNGTISLKTTWMEGRDGRIYEYSWMFGEVGLDRFLTDLSINRRGKNASDNDDTAAPVNDEAELMDAFGNASLDRDNAEEKKQVGKIVVTLMRVTVGERWQASHYRVQRKQDEQGDVDMTGVKEVSHTTEFTAGDVIERSVPCINFSPYVAGEENFAEFTFFYRDEDTLRRYGFQDFPLPPRPKPNRTPGAVSRRLRSNVVSSINSLSPLPNAARSDPASERKLTGKQRDGSRASPPPVLPLTTDGSDEGSDADDEAIASIETQSATSPYDTSFRNFKVPARANLRSTKAKPPPPYQKISVDHNRDANDEDSEASTIMNASFGSSSSHPRARAPSPTDTLITSFSLSTKEYKKAMDFWNKQRGLTFRPSPSNITHDYNTRHAASVAQEHGTAPTKKDENIRPIKDVDRKRTRARSEELASPPPLDLYKRAVDGDELGSLRAKRHKSITPDQLSRGRRRSRRSSSTQRAANLRRTMRARRSASIDAEADGMGQGRGDTMSDDADVNGVADRGAAAAGVPGLMVTPASEP